MAHQKLSRKEINEYLWRPDLPPGSRIYAILDGARDRRIYSALIGSAQEQVCLYRGDLPWQLAMAAPYLVHLDQEDKLTDQIFDQWGNAWGIFVQTTVSMERLRRHLRTFLRVKDEQGRILLFRYYDPRVMRVYLPTCWPNELKAVFGPIDRILMEADDPSEALEFTHDIRGLHTRVISRSETAASTT